MEHSSLRQSLCVMYVLLERELLQFKTFFINNFFDAAIWVSLTLCMFRYTFAKAGMDGSDFALFMISGNVVSWGLLEIMGPLTHLVSDITGKRSLEYTLTLPIVHRLVFVTMGISFALKSMLSSMLVLPIAKLVFWNELSFTSIAWGKFIAIFILQNFFFGFLTLFLASILYDIRAIRHVFRRFVFPLWWLGGYTFSFNQVYNYSPKLSYLALCNPLLYAFEGIRGAILGQQGYINFWCCLLMLFIATSVLACFAINNLFTRLDCVEG